MSAPKVDVRGLLTAILNCPSVKTSEMAYRRRDAYQARTALDELIEACAPAVSEEGMTQVELNRLRAALAHIGGGS